MSKKSQPISYRKLRYKMDQGFLDIQYSVPMYILNGIRKLVIIGLVRIIFFSIINEPGKLNIVTIFLHIVDYRKISTSIPLFCYIVYPRSSYQLPIYSKLLYKMGHYFLDIQYIPV